ncbi:restriction endonuclease subunit S [Streptococcus sp. BJSWXB6CM1]|uniref:Restriction endonuclease subunit S n=1 Tax=Streptococcus fermentans TaxID=3095082 RepID=A0ABU5FYP3_9STRE|nr:MULTISPECIES: restriction endonuclease subunit S [unclassified Streptococcus]MDY4346473.1 restriction endonuclease subunit S [Streptococcus sp. BJSWXB5TM5]MDY4361480.1 restriction endonuclease subunit S [Streptococcus sp. BJSWXB3CM3]MDY4371639.1 restriction endonuclease subunit S [Streptococcus sp. BJSWXB6CM1]
MSKWKEVSLSKIGKTITGKTPSSQYPEDFGDEMPFITPSDSFEKKYMNKSDRFLSRSGSDRLKDKIISPNSIMVTCIGSAMGKVAKNSLPSVTNQQINSIIVNENFDSDYIYYLLKNNYTVLRNAASGSTAIPILNKTDFDNLRFKVELDLNEQRKMVSILSTIDDKIETNNQINQELEAMAKTLYDYWFVQFDFPDQNGKPYKSSGGKMVYHPELKREIPEGWGVTTFSSWISDNKTGDWGKETSEGNYTLEVDCIRGADINGLSGNGKTDMPTRFILEKNKNKLLTDFDIVIEISGGSPTQSTGRIVGISENVLNRFDLPLICSNFCKAVSLKEQETFYNFVYEWKNLYDNGVLFSWEGKTSGIKNLLFDSFVTNYHIAQPPIDLMKQFFDYASSVDKKTQLLLKQNQELTQLRDWLLPMLMNGQVKVE